ncbi:MAG: ABC transporter permease [Anaerolineae bacterium]
MAQLVKYRYLLWQWTAREVRVRYKQSVLGAAWAMLQPLALTLAFTLVFSRIVHVDTGGIPYPLFTYSALIPWTFFTTGMSTGVPSLVNNINLVSKIYFPREILPLGAIMASLLDLLMAFIVLIIMMIFYHVEPTIMLLWLFPLLIVEIGFTTAITLIGSAAIVFLRDVRFVVPLVIQIWMYATPIIYPTQMIPERLRTLYFLNPMAGIIDSYRRVVTTGEAPQAIALGLAVIITIVSLWAGYAMFKWAEPQFADLI